MEIMELIIKIDKELYEAYKGKPPMLGDAGMDMIAQAIAQGTPYEPKGDLISREWIRKEVEEYRLKQAYDAGDEMRNTMVDWIEEDIDNAPTVSPYKAIHDELHKGEEE